MRLIALPFTVAALAALVSAAGQDLVSVAPGATRVEYEDARIRVVRLRIPPRGALPQHDRPARVVVSLTPNDVRLTRADGTTSVTRTEAGTFAWSGPAVRSVLNLADAPVENIVIELKGADAPAKPIAGPPIPTPSDYLDEPRHRWAFENQYVRAFDVRIPPGETTGWHRHALDAVAVFVTGGLVATQMQGEPWGKSEKIDPGAVSFSPEASEPYTHRARNEGTSEYRVILVQFLRR